MNTSTLQNNQIANEKVPANLQDVFAKACKIILCKHIFALVIAVLMSSGVWGQAVGDYRTTGVGNWNAAIWERYNGAAWVAPGASGFPGQNAGTGTVTIRNNHNVTLNVSPTNNIGSLEIASGGNATALTFGAAWVLSVNGDVSVSSVDGNVAKSIVLNTGTLNCNNLNLTSTGGSGGGANIRDAFVVLTTGTLSVSGNIEMNAIGRRTYLRFNGGGTVNVGGTISGGNITSTNNGDDTTAPTSGTVNYNGTSGTQAVGTYTYFNLIISGTGNKTSASTAFTVNSNLTVNSGNLVLQAGNANYTVVGNLTVAAAGTLTHSVNWDVSTTLLRLGGNLLIEGAYDYSAVTRAHVQMYGSDRTINTGTAELSILTLNTGGAITANGPVTVNDNFWAMFNIANGSFSTGTNTITAKSALLVAGGTVNIQNGGTFNVTGGIVVGTGTNNGIVNLAAGGALNTDGLTLGDGTRTGTFNHSGGTANINGDLLIRTSCTYTCSNAPTINVSGNFTKDGTFTAASSTVVLNGGGAQTIGGTTNTVFNNITINNGAGINLAANQTVGGALTLTHGAFSIGANTLTLNGTIPTCGTLVGGATSNLTIGGAAANTNIPSVTLNNLTLNRANGATLCGNVTINNQLTLTSGNLSLSNHNLALGASATISGTPNGSRMIETNGTGSLVKQSTTAAGLGILYPVGTGGNYTPVQLSSTTGSVTGTATLAVRAVAGRADNTNITDLGKHWVLESTNLTGVSTNASFTYVASEMNGNEADYTLRYSTNPVGTWSAPANAALASRVLSTTGSNVIDGVWTAREVTTTWYTLRSGNWNDPTIWTLDPAGSLINNPSNTFPQLAGDNVVVKNGRTVAMNISNVACKNLTVEGTLDLASTSGHSFTSINGNGRIRMSANNSWPTGNATHFITPGQGEGTVEYYGNNFSLSTARTFYNMEVMITAGQTLTLTSNFTLNGNLEIKTGTFSINDNTATIRNIEIRGNVEVSNGASIITGTGNTIGSHSIGGTMPSSGNYHNIFHQFTVWGNFTNNGSVRFTNLTAPNYSQFANNGAVTVRFKGATNNTLFCNGVTDFYNLVVDKGTDQTYILEINSSATGNFALLGPNIVGRNENAPFSASNPEVRKALWIYNGTLKLTGDIAIPTLSEGDSSGGNGDYTIGSNACMWIASPNVSVFSTASAAGQLTAGAVGLNSGSSNQALSVYGQFRISAGNFGTRNSAGFIFWSAANAVLMIEGGTCDVAQFRSASSGSGQTSYIQTGGVLKVRGNVTEAGEVTNAYPLFGFETVDGTFSMSGGEIIINAESGNTNDIYIPVSEGNYNITGGKLTVSVNGSTVVDYNSTVPFYNIEIGRLNASNTASLSLRSALVALNNLVIGNHSSLVSNNNNVTVGSNFSLGTTSSTYTAGTNTTTFNGAQNSTITNGSAFTFHRVDISKSAHVTPGQLYTVSLDGPSTIAVSNNLTITQGQLATKTVSPTVGGNIEIINGGVTNTSGALVLNGGALQTLNGNGNAFGSITLNNGNNGVQLLSNAIMDNLSFNTGTTTGKVNLQTYNLKVNGTISNVDATRRWIYGTGNASDGGLSVYINANGSKTYPIGVASKYTPAAMSVTGYSDDGYVTIVPVNSALQTTNQAGGALLPYYWKVKHDDFTALPTVTYVFTYAETDNTSYVPGKVLDVSPYTRTSYNDVNKVVEASKTILFDTPVMLERANYLAGLNNRFTGTVATFYSNSWYGNWNSGAIWNQGSKVGSTGTVPTAGSIVYIYGVARIWGNAIPNVPAEIIFEHDYSAHPIPDGENVPRLQFNTEGTFNIGRVSGTGMISFEANTAITLNGDFGEFGTNPDSYYLYYGGAAGGNTLTNIPTPIPSLMLEGTAKNINQAITVNSDFIIHGGTTVTPFQNVSIGRDLLIGLWNGGTFSFRGSGASTTINVGRNIDFTKAPGGTFGTRTIVCETTANDVSHRLIVAGNIIHGSQNTSVFDLYNGATNRNRVVLELVGAGSHSYSRTSTARPDFYQIVVNKGTGNTNSFTFDQHFTIYEGGNNTATKSITLQNGALILNSAEFVNLNLTSGGAHFGIPGSSALVLQNGIYTATGTSGIALNGLLRISGGTLNMAGADNPIVYGAGGASTIDVSAGTLIVGGQVRRSANSEVGVLKYNQSGGDVFLGRSTTSVATRGTLEVLGVGSEFNVTGGNLFIERSSAATIPGLYLIPGSYNLSTGNTINIGSGSVAGQSVGVYSSIPLQNLQVLNGATARLLTVSLTLNGNLTIAAGTFNANGLDLNIGGNFVNNATFTHGNNTVTFTGGTVQSISGTTATGFFNLTKQGASTLNTLTASTVNNNLSVLSGALADNGNTITVNGNANIEGTHVYGNAGEGIRMAGSVSLQTLTGNGSIGMLTINNVKGVYVPIGNLLTINNKLRLNAGVLNVDKNLLTLGVNSTIDGNAFSATNMIQTNVSFTDNGVKKVFPAGASGSFVFPVGSNGKYTPVTFNVTGNGNATGSIRVKPAAEYHPSIQEDSEAPLTEIVDKDNVLQYYWILISSGISGFNSTASFKYEQEDVKATNGNTEAQYIAARLLSDESGDWNKYTTAEVDDLNNLILFSYSNAQDDDISGDYTAGIDNAIPAKVPQYISVKNGDWADASIWDTYPVSGGFVPSTGPRGSIAYVRHSVVSAGNGIVSYKTIIDANNGNYGNVITNATFGHRLGIVSGTGTLTCSVGDLPAADYTDFFKATGGALEYNGSSNIDILPDFPQINNLLLSGSGIRRLPNINLQLLGWLTINGPTVDNDTYDRTFSVKGNITFNSGSFAAGNQSSAKLVMNGTSLQTINGTSSFTTATNDLFHFEINNPVGITINRPVDVSGNLILTNGVLNTSDTNILKITSATSTASAGNSTAFVNGPLQKQVNAGATFAFPVGNAGRFGPITLENVSAPGLWRVQYHNRSANEVGLTTSMQAPVQFVGTNEYWNIQAPASATAVAMVRWDDASGVNPAEPGLCGVQWITNRWHQVTLSSITGNTSSGTAKTSSTLSFNANTGGNFITFGSITIPAYTWNGNTNTDWFTATNWSNTIVPSAGSTTTIGNTTNKPLIAGNTVAQTNGLIIVTGATLTIAPGGKLTVNGDLSVADAGGLKLESETGADKLASLITKGNITGSSNIKLTLPHDQWYYISSAINEARLGNFDTGGSTGTKVHVFRNNQWFSTGINNVNTATLKLEGVLVKYDAGPKTLNYTGVPNNGIIERNFTAGWNLFGNPYPSFINWQEDAGWSRPNIDGTIWYRTKQGEVMTFITYNRNAVSGARVALYPEGSTWGNEAEMANIPPMQAVWVKAYAATTVTINNSARNHSVAGSRLKSSSTGSNADIIRIVANNGQSRDGAVIYFSSQSIDGMDAGDSEKRFNDSELVPEIYTRIGSAAAAINGTSRLDENIRTIPLSVRNKVANEVTLEFNLSMFSADYKVELEDKLTGDMVNLKSSPDYDYTPSAVGDVHDRFVLHINYEPIQVVVPDEDETDGGTNEGDSETGNTDDGAGEDTGNGNTDGGTTPEDNTDGDADNNDSGTVDNPAETDQNQVSTTVNTATTNGITITGMRGRAVVTVKNNLLDYGDAKIEIFTMDGQKVSEAISGAATTLVALPKTEAVFIVKVTAGSQVKIQKVMGKM